MSIKEANKQWFDHWSVTYDRFILRRLIHYWQRLAISELSPGSKVILDIACGTGVGAALLAKKFPEASIIAGDISDGMLSIARQRLSKFTNVTVMKADVEQLRHISSCDAIICTEAFHHFPNPARSMAEMSRVLRPGGKIVIVDISIPPVLLWNILFRLEPGFVHMYSKKEFHSLATNAGLLVEKQRRVGVFAVMTVARKPK